MAQGNHGARRLHLHVGAHKTATTRLQTVLVNNARLLRSRGVAVFCPSAERLGLESAQAPDGDRTNDIATIFPLRLLLNRKKRRERIEATLYRLANRWRLHAQGANLAVISEENLLTEAAGYPLVGPLYPRAGKNLSMLRRALPVQPDRVFLAVRDYASFFESLYAEGARWFLVPREDAVRASVLRHVVELHAGWYSVARVLANTFPDATIEIWRHEAFDERRRLAALLDGRCEGLDRASGGDNVRISRTAVSQLQIACARGEAPPEEITPAGPDDTLCLFDARDRAVLAEAYTRDLEQMRKAGVSVVDY